VLDDGNFADMGRINRDSLSAATVMTPIRILLQTKSAKVVRMVIRKW
jgi:hypothetical protein